MQAKYLGIKIVEIKPKKAPPEGVDGIAFQCNLAFGVIAILLSI